MEDVWFDINKGVDSLQPFWISASNIRSFSEESRTVYIKSLNNWHKASREAAKDIVQYIRDHEYKPSKKADL